MDTGKKARRELENELAELRQEIPEPESTALRNDQTKGLIWTTEEDFRELVDAADSPVLICSLNGRIRHANHHVSALLEYSPEELAILPVLSLYHPDERDMIVDRVNRSMQGEVALPMYSTTLISRTGDKLWVEIYAMVIQYGNQSAFLLYIKDLSLEKRLQAELQQAHKMEAMGTLSGGIAHDFNNILGIILGNTEMAIQDVPEWNPAQTNLSAIKEACMRARDVTKQILAFSRQEQQEITPVQINSVISESLRLIRSTIPTTIDIHQNIAGEINVIMGDSTQINQVLLNLCANAYHSMGENGGIINVSLERIYLDDNDASALPSLTVGNYAKLSISDTGQGIASKEIDRIFDPYFTTKAVGEGTGMGLAVVHGIIKHHNGAITVNSEIGKGTTFDIYFPIVEDESEIEPKSTEAIPVGAEHILFVDDEPAMTQIYKSMLERLGYTVSARTSSIEALEAFKAQPDKYDLIITDQTMPHMTGKMLAAEIMAIRPDTPVILCTGHSDLIGEKRAGEMGIRAFVMKPIAMGEIAKTIREVLD